MTPFDSKQFEVKREDQAIARWIGPKDDTTIAQLLDLFRREKWKGQLVISYAGNGGSVTWYSRSESSPDCGDERRFALLTKII